MSFGYYDNEWVDPDDDDLIYNTIVIEFDKEPLKVFDGGYGEFLREDEIFDDYIDEDVHVLILDKEDMMEAVYDCICGNWGSEDDGKILLLSGTVKIDYSVPTWATSRMDAEHEYPKAYNITLEEVPEDEVLDEI